MNLDTLNDAEARFLATYPGGFQHPDMVAIGKRHKMDSMIALAQEHLAKEKFRDSQVIVDTMAKVVSRSSMVSMFEKPKFRDFCRSMSPNGKRGFAAGMKAFLHGDQKKGFEAVLDVLKAGKLGRWSLLTSWPAYFRPNDEVFIKPTTAKGVIAYFELESLIYRPTPTWDFYTAYRTAITEMKTHVDPSLAPNNAAFCGFLMVSMEGSTPRDR